MLEKEDETGATEDVDAAAAADGATAPRLFVESADGWRALTEEVEDCCRNTSGQSFTSRLRTRAALRVCGASRLPTADPPGARFEYGLKPYIEPYATGLLPSAEAARRLFASGDELPLPTRSDRRGTFSAPLGDSIRAGRALASGRRLCEANEKISIDINRMIKDSDLI